MFKITICTRTEVVQTVTCQEKEGLPFHAVISIESPGAPPEEDRAPRLAETLGQEWRDRQIILACYDVTGPEYGVPMPDSQIVYEAIAHAEKWHPEEGDFRLLIHCHQGVSRSPAVALVLMRYYRGPGTEQQCLDDLLNLRPPAMPNTTIIEHGDEIASVVTSKPAIRGHFKTGHRGLA
jgi:predicted protein tyrosine phosphatase